MTASELIPRTVKLTAEDWAEFDRQMKCVLRIETLLIEEATWMLFDARPRPPRTVELDEVTWTEQDDGWWASETGGSVLASDPESQLGKALRRIWDLEHPEETDNE